MNRKTLIILFLIFVLGYFLRVVFLSNNVLTFGYDQARDAYHALEIVSGKLKIFGPPASQPGLFHGVLYYYVLAPFYFLGKGSPIVAAYGIAFVNCLAVFVVYFLAFLMTRNKVTSLIAGFLFAISFEATQYATWLSNPTLGILTVPLMYLGLWLWISSQKKSLAPAIIAAIGLGFSVQSEIFLVYHLVPLVIWLFVARKKITKKQIFLFLLTLAITLSSMLLVQLKFGIGKTLIGFQGLALNENANLAYAKSIGDYLVLYLNQVGRIFAFNSYPGNIGYGGGFVIFLILLAIFKAKKFSISPNLFLVTWLLSHLAVVSVGGTSTPFLMVGIGPAVSLLISLFLAELWQKKLQLAVVAVLGILIFGNISMILRENRNGATLFSIQKDMVLNKEIRAIDYTYQKTKGEAFSLNSVTSPLWINIVWTYLYNWYGKDHYGYVPTWHGKGQEGQIASLTDDGKRFKNSFLIVEPMAGIPPRYLEETIGVEDSITKLIEENNFGEIRVQQRIKI